MQSLGTHTTTLPVCGAGTQGQRFVLSADGKEVCDTKTGLYWEQAPSTLSFTYETGGDQCLALGGGRRLPEITELGTLIDYSVGDQSALLNAGPFSGVMYARYWTATAVANFPWNAWTVSFMNADFGVASQNSTFPVWCVH